MHILNETQNIWISWHTEGITYMTDPEKVAVYFQMGNFWFSVSTYLEKICDIPNMYFLANLLFPINKNNITH